MFFTWIQSSQNPATCIHHHWHGCCCACSSLILRSPMPSTHLRTYSWRPLRTNPMSKSSRFLEHITKYIGLSSRSFNCMSDFHARKHRRLAYTREQARTKSQTTGLLYDPVPSYRLLENPPIAIYKCHRRPGNITSSCLPCSSNCFSQRWNRYHLPSSREIRAGLSVDMLNIRGSRKAQVQPLDKQSQTMTTRLDSECCCLVTAGPSACRSAKALSKIAQGRRRGLAFTHFRVCGSLKLWQAIF